MEGQYNEIIFDDNTPEIDETEIRPNQFGEVKSVRGSVRAKAWSTYRAEERDIVTSTATVLKNVQKQEKKRRKKRKREKTDINIDSETIMDADDLDAYSISEESTNFLLVIPEIDRTRPMTRREKLIEKEKIKNFKQQKKYARVIAINYRNLSYFTCFIIISVTGFFYPFNIFERLLERNLGVIPANIVFLGSTGTCAFFVAAGSFGVLLDHYGPALGLFVGAILALIGNLTLAGAFQHFWKIEFSNLCIYYTVMAAGYGLAYSACFIASLKSSSVRHRAKVNGIMQCLWLIGAYTTPLLDQMIYLKFIHSKKGKTSYYASGEFEVDEFVEGKRLEFRAIWISIMYFAAGLIVRVTPSFWWKHRDYNYKPYFKPLYDKQYSMKALKDVRYWSMIMMGGFMIAASYFYPSSCVLILDSFRERSYANFYKEIIAVLSSITVFVCGILIDMIKWYRNPAIFLLLSIILVFISNMINIFNMYFLLLLSLAVNAVGLGLFWSSFPIVMIDNFGANNFGRNIGFSFVFGGLICGFLQTLAGEWYAQMIHNGGTRCHGADCWLHSFILNQGVVLISFLLFMVLPYRTSQKRDLRQKGIIAVNYLDQKAENDFLASRMHNKPDNDAVDTPKSDDYWVDGSIKYADDMAEYQFNASDHGSRDMAGADESTKESSEWSKSGVIYADEDAEFEFEEGIKEGKQWEKDYKKNKSKKQEENDEAMMFQDQQEDEAHKTEKVCVEILISVSAFKRRYHTIHTRFKCVYRLNFWQISFKTIEQCGMYIIGLTFLGQSATVSPIAIFHIDLQLASRVYKQ